MIPHSRWFSSCGSSEIPGGLFRAGAAGKTQGTSESLQTLTVLRSVIWDFLVPRSSVKVCFTDTPFVHLISTATPPTLNHFLRLQTQKLHRTLYSSQRCGQAPKRGSCHPCTGTRPRPSAPMPQNSHPWACGGPSRSGL